MNTNQSKQFNVKFPHLDPGRHDILVLAIRDPDNTLEEKKMIAPENAFLSRRVTVLVDSDKSPSIKFSNVQAKRDEEVSAVPFITTSSNRTFSGSLSLITKDELKQNLSLNMVSDMKRKFAIICFFGNKQLKLEKPFISVISDGHFAVDLPQINKKEVKEPQNLIIGVIPDPFESKGLTNSEGVLFSNILTIQN